MKVISTNIGKPTTIIWNGKEITTGIYKNPTSTPIYLGKENVKGDEVSNRSVHGGEYKACYLFSLNQYKYWQNLYPNLEWKHGMFGENLTVKDLDESTLNIGDIYKVGTALIQITQSREPCFKFGIKFGSQNMLKQFIDHGFPGTYVRVLEEGYVKNDDEFELVKRIENSLSITAFFNLLFTKNKNQELLNLAISNDALPIKKRNKLKGYLKNG